MDLGVPKARRRVLDSVAREATFDSSRMQLLAYHIVVQKGCDVDQPRNLAKTVTVE